MISNRSIFNVYLFSQNSHALHQDHQHKSEGHAPSSRAAAEHTGGKTAVSFPANKTIQRYTEDNFFDTDFRFSEDIRMAVEKNDAKLFLAEHGVQVGEPVLIEIYKDEEDRIFKIGIDYVKDCGEYAMKLMREMSGITKRERGSMQITNADVKEGVTDFSNTFENVIPISAPAPGVGEAFYVYNNPKDVLFGKKGGHFNFHWGAVVAKSGSDVITAEADSNAADMWFQMYNTSIFGQSFKDHWYTKGKLDETAKAFEVQFIKRPKKL
jgi:hypothetical protein